MDFHPLSTKSEHLLIEFILNSTRGGGTLKEYNRAEVITL